MRWPRSTRLLCVLLALAAAQALVVIVYRGIEHGRRNREGPTFPYERLSGAMSADLLLLRPDGSSRTLADLRGKPVLLHFWATWCPPCKEELPGLIELARELARDGRVELVALTVDRDWDAVEQFFGGAIPPEVMMDGLGAATARYGLSTLPDTYLLRADGTLQLRFFGVREWDSKRARDVLARELDSGGGGSSPTAPAER
jgi:thiol-disulfide isomerase/thioredoxin